MHSGCCRRSWGERLPGTPLPPGPLHWHRDCQARAAGRMQTTALRDQLTPPAGALGTTGPPLSPQRHTSRAPPPSTPKHAHGGWSGGSHISQVLGSLAGATLGSPLGDFSPLIPLPGISRPPPPLLRPVPPLPWTRRPLLPWPVPPLGVWGHLPGLVHLVAHPRPARLGRFWYPGRSCWSEARLRESIWALG